MQLLLHAHRSTCVHSTNVDYSSKYSLRATRMRIEISAFLCSLDEKDGRRALLVSCKIAGA